MKCWSLERIFSKEHWEEWDSMEAKDKEKIEKRYETNKNYTANSRYKKQ